MRTKARNSALNFSCLTIVAVILVGIILRHEGVMLSVAGLFFILMLLNRVTRKGKR